MHSTLRPGDPLKVGCHRWNMSTRKLTDLEVLTVAHKRKANIDCFSGSAYDTDDSLAVRVKDLLGEGKSDPVEVDADTTQGKAQNPGDFSAFSPGRASGGSSKASTLKAEDFKGSDWMLPKSEDRSSPKHLSAEHPELVGKTHLRCTASHASCSLRLLHAFGQ